MLFDLEPLPFDRFYTRLHPGANAAAISGLDIASDAHPAGARLEDLAVSGVRLPDNRMYESDVGFSMSFEH